VVWYLFSITHHYFWYSDFRYYNFSDFRPPNKKELNVMWDKSPIAYLEQVKAPTLIALGMKDRRVPPSQGIEYYHALRAKKLPTKLLVYDDCDHALDLVASEADFWINTKVSIPV
jgi:acylaminoacyl-peptidase